MVNTTDSPRALSVSDLFALASEWDAESKRLFAEAKEKWHMSDNLDLEHQAKVLRRCSSDLQKLIRANVAHHSPKEPKRLKVECMRLVSRSPWVSLAALSRGCLPDRMDLPKEDFRTVKSTQCGQG